MLRCPQFASDLDDGVYRKGGQEAPYRAGHEGMQIPATLNASITATPRLSRTMMLSRLPVVVRTRLA